MGSSQHTNLVLFDGVCNLCNGFVKFLVRQDRRQMLSFGSLQSDEVQRLMADDGIHSQDKLTKEGAVTSVIYIRRGQYYTRSTAVLHILGDLGGLWQITGIFWLIPRSFRDLIYNWISRNRYRWWGRQTSCMVVTPGLQKRFIN